MKKTAVLLIQLGTPDSPKTSDVRRYLSEFLNDPRVIDLPWFARKLLVNGAIVPFRAPKSAKIYKQLWDLGNGQSPLLLNTQKVQEKLESRFKLKSCIPSAVSAASVLNKYSEFAPIMPDASAIILADCCSGCRATKLGWSRLIINVIAFTTSPCWFLTLTQLGA